MNQLYILLLALWSAFNSSDAWDPDERTTRDPRQMMNESHPTFSTDIYPMVLEEEDLDSWGTAFDVYEPESDNVPELNIAVYRQIEDREHVIVLCKFGMTHGWQSIELSVESELDYTIEPVEFFPFYYSEMQVFLVTVRPPASFTCVHEIDSDLDVRNLRSQTYNYSGSVSDHPEEGASLLYICFSSFIAVGLFIMTAAVIVINIRSKTKDTNSTAVTNNDYVEA
uniref:Uncharacterized protein n=1 Tax=Cyprinus carpio TaxID=7962 RepID=A0A8C1KV62_CYPCA